MKLPGLACLFVLAVVGGCASSVAGRADAATADPPNVDAATADILAMDATIADLPAVDTASCAAGQLSCGSRCADPATDPAHCGGCGRVCPTGTVCLGSFCLTTCATGLARCGASCTDLRTSATHCGACTTTCPAVAGATPSCVAGACGFACTAGFADCDSLASNGCEADLSTPSHCGGCGRACPIGATCADGACVCPPGRRLVAGACVVDTAPRPLAPLSLGDVTQRRPTLQWVLAAGYDGAVVELCRDRSCTMPLETLTVSGSSARPTSDLPARSVVFWRLRGRMRAATDAFYGPTWLFHVPAVSAPGGIDTSAHPHLDINGDGFDDLVVGGPHGDPGPRQEAGTVGVFYGSATGAPSPPGTGREPDRLLEGAAWYDWFGDSVAGAGDVNGDGYADLVVGAPGADPGGRDGAGTASVFYGSATWTPSPEGTARPPDRLLEGVAEGDAFGGSVAAAGDVNGDGYADLVVGARYASPGGRTNAGTASVFYGSATWTAAPPGTPSAPDRLLEGARSGDLLGESVAGAGDINSDSYADLVVGAPGASPEGRTEAGTVSVFYGGATWTPGLSGTPRTPDRLLEGAAMGDHFGESVANAGDLNGDGFDDLVVGTHRASPGGRTNAGTASVFYGSATWTPSPAGTPRAPDRLFEGDAADGYFGISVAGAGDVNGDGFGDLVVGASQAAAGTRRFAGTASVFYGSATWTPSPTGTPRVPDRLFEGAAEGDAFGGSVAGAGDVNGDGDADLVIGAPNASSEGSTQAGTASVFYGSATWTPSPAGTPRVPDRLLGGVWRNGHFGSSVASTGDAVRDRNAAFVASLRVSASVPAPRCAPRHPLRARALTLSTPAARCPRPSPT